MEMGRCVCCFVFRNLFSFSTDGFSLNLEVFDVFALMAPSCCFGFIFEPHARMHALHELQATNETSSELRRLGVKGLGNH